MKSHITEAGEPVSQHLAMESRHFPAAGPSKNGRVSCNRCGAAFSYDDGVPAGWEYVEAAGIGSYNCPAHAIREPEWKLGGRARTSFDGEVYPGVYEIVGFKDGYAQLESNQCTRTWCPVADLVPADDAPPLDALLIKHANQIIATAKLIGGLNPERAKAALTLLKGLICLDCGTPLTEGRPRCFCMRDG